MASFDEKAVLKKVFNYILLIALAVVILAPFFIGIWTSFLPTMDIAKGNLFSTNLSLDNYAAAFTKTPILRYLLNTLVISTITMIAQLIFCSMSAYAFVFLKFKFRKTIFTLFLVTMMLPFEAEIIPNFATVKQMGLLDNYAVLIIPFLTSAFGTFMLRQSFMQTPIELKEASDIEGLNHFQFYWNIVLSYNKISMITLGAYSFLGSWNQYLWPMLTTFSNNSRVIQNGLKQLQSEETFNDWGMIQASAAIIVIPTIIVLFIGQHYFKSGMNEGPLNNVEIQKLTLPLILILGIVFVAVFGKALSAKSAVKDNRTPIVFWHEMGGPSEQALEQVVDGFNKSQNKYKVIPKYQGTYDEAIQKILQTHNTSTSPAVFQAFDISTAQMLHSGYTTPVQNFIDEDNYDVSKISPVARAFYSNDGKQQAMPFNTSQPVLYYNASLLKKYNITPPPVSPSYSDITRVAKELYEKSGHKTKGMTIQVYGWFLEQALANAGAQLANQNDGHTGNPTQVKINNPDTVEFLNWIKENIKSGDFIDYGSGASAGANQTAGFLSDKVGIFIQSSASIGQLTQNNKNKLGITYFPHPDDKKANGVAIGGAALWISNDKPKNVQRGAFEFIKYTLKPEVQAQWQKSTGYLALNKDSQKTKILKDLYAKSPESKVPGQQLATAKPNYSNSGILMEGMQLTRQLEEVAMETVYNGGDINQALNTADKNINDNLMQLNKANGYK